MKLTTDDLFVLCSMPGSTDTRLYLDDKASNSKAFYFRAFDICKHQGTYIHTEAAILNPKIQFQTTSLCHIASTSKPEYLEQAAQIMACIRSKICDKIILSRIKVEDTNDCDYAALFNQIVFTYPKAFTFFFNVPGHGSWMGASPELLLESDIDGFKTIALAGTKAIDDLQKDSVNWGQKEINEQQIIVDYLSEKLSEFDINYVAQGPKTVKAGKMYHLKTSFISADKVDALQIANSIHPGPAISGYPVNKSIDTIKKVERHDRGFYCGYMGPCNDVSTQFYVNLRCMQIFSDAVCLYAGGGYTIDSIPENEWDETELKCQTLLSVLEDLYITTNDIQ